MALTLEEPKDLIESDALDPGSYFDLDIRITVQPDPGHDAISYSQWHSCNTCYKCGNNTVTSRLGCC